MPERNNSALEIIEESGKVFEKFGLTPMQGRIVAFFTVADKNEKTFDEIVTFFKASKSTISNSINYLLQNRIIDYKTVPSDRKRYFFITDSFVDIYFSRVLSNLAELRENTYRTVSMRNPDYPATSEKLLKWIGNVNRFEEALTRVLGSGG